MKGKQIKKLIDNYVIAMLFYYLFNLFIFILR